MSKFVFRGKNASVLFCRQLLYKFLRYMMTEKEKMLAGEMYDATNPELTEDRLRCKEICYDYNNARPRMAEEKKNLLQNLLGKMEEFCIIEPPFWCDYGYNIRVGKNFYANHGMVILDCAEVTFGDNVFIGPDCGFYTAQHPLDVEVRNTFVESARPIRIGHNVWIGGKVCVLPGVTIGSGSVIAAGSVVTRDVEPYSLMAGNPAVLKRKLNIKNEKRDTSAIFTERQFPNSNQKCIEQLGLDSSEDAFDDYVDCDGYENPLSQPRQFDQLGLDSCAD